MLPETVARLAAACPQIIGIKEACGDMDQIRNLIGAVPGGFLVISGDDLTAAPTVLEGGAGVISVLGQAIPEAFTRMIRTGIDGDRESALHQAETLQPLIGLIFREGNPAGIKALLSREGICGSRVRLPLVAASHDLVRDLDTFMATFGRQRV